MVEPRVLHQVAERPAEACLRIVRAEDETLDARVPRLIFGAYDPKAGFCGSLGDLVRDPRLNHRLEVQGGFMEERARELLQQFFRSLRSREKTERWQSG